MTTQTRATPVRPTTLAITPILFATSVSALALLWIALGSPANLADDRAFMCLPVALIAALAVGLGQRSAAARGGGFFIVAAAAFGALGWRVATPAMADDMLMGLVPAVIVGAVLVGASRKRSSQSIAFDAAVGAGLVVATAMAPVPALWALMLLAGLAMRTVSTTAR